MTWVCIDCGARQEAQGRCAACGHEDTLDTRDERVRELMRDVELRLSLRREGRFRFIGVGIGMVLVSGRMIPGYWTLRGSTFALPFLFDQWIFMVLIGLGVLKLLAKVFGKKRFPYLGVDLQIH